MDKQAIYEEIRRLRSVIDYHAQRYYVHDDPEISDYEYDKMHRYHNGN